MLRCPGAASACQCGAGRHECPLGPIGRAAARTHERVRQVQLVDTAHECQVLGTHWLGQVVHRASADLAQFDLLGNWQFVISVNSVALRSAIPLW